MDRKQLISAISLSVLVFALWTAFQLWYEKHHPQPQTSNVPAATQPAAVTPGATTSPSTTNPAVAPVMSAGMAATPGTQPSGPIYLGSAARNDPKYAMQIALTPDGAGVLEVTLNQFDGPNQEKRKKEEREIYRFESPIPNHNGTNAFATRALLVDDKTVDLWNVPWTKDSSDRTSATLSTVIHDGSGKPVAKITKTYKLPGRDTPSLGYEVEVTHTIENLRTDQPIKARAIVNGPTPPPEELEQSGTDRMVVVGYDEAGKKIAVVQVPYTDFKAESPNKDLTQKDSDHFAWGGQMSTYFAALVLPEPEQRAQFTMHGDAINPLDEAKRSASLTVESIDLQIAPGQSATLPLNVFLGPKWRQVVNTTFYNGMPRRYDELLNTQSWCSNWCSSQTLVRGLVALLGFFHTICLGDWGLAIILLVLLVRTLLHPITKRAQVKMMQMGKLAPEVEKLKKKYADQPDVLNREMMQLYKQQGGAILGCLPMFLQTPIWIALFTALQGTFELRQAPFLFGWTWIHDLAKPDRLIDFNAWLGHPIPLLFGWHLWSLNILPLSMAVVTYINQKYFMPTPIAATPEQEQQQKMQRGMSLIFPLMFYTFPSGLNLYYLTSMTLGIVESKIIRDHIKQQDELEKLRGPEIVSTKPTRASRRRDGTPDKGPQKPGLMERFMKAMADAQKQAEQMRKDSNKGKK